MSAYSAPNFNYFARSYNRFPSAAASASAPASRPDFRKAAGLAVPTTRPYTGLAASYGDREERRVQPIRDRRSESVFGESAATAASLGQSYLNKAASLAVPAGRSIHGQTAALAVVSEPAVWQDVATSSLTTWGTLVTFWIAFFSPLTAFFTLSIRFIYEEVVFNWRNHIFHWRFYHNIIERYCGRYSANPGVGLMSSIKLVLAFFLTSHLLVIRGVKWIFEMPFDSQFRQTLKDAIEEIMDKEEVSQALYWPIQVGFVLLVLLVWCAVIYIIHLTLNFYAEELFHKTAFQLVISISRWTRKTLSALVGKFLNQHQSTPPTDNRRTRRSSDFIFVGNPIPRSKAFCLRAWIMDLAAASNDYIFSPLVKMLVPAKAEIPRAIVSPSDSWSIPTGLDCSIACPPTFTVSPMSQSPYGGPYLSLSPELLARDAARAASVLLF